MSWRVSCDTGGTFTDAVVTDAHGFRTLAKASTTPKGIVDGIEGSVRRAAEKLGLGIEELLRDTERFVLATTKATNAILEGTTGRTAFLTTAGFPDVLLFREGGKADPFDFTRDTPPPYVPRHLTFEIAERVAADGEVLVALDEDEVRDVAARLRELDVEAVGVCFLWATVDPSHERRVGEILAEACPELSISLSHQVNPVVREYRRASATVMDASLKPLVQSHLREVQQRLAELGLATPPMMATSSGGVLDMEAVIARPLLALDCGPAMAPIAARAWAGADERAQSEPGSLIVVDTGGTSFDVSLVRDGEIAVTSERWLGARWTGHMTGIAAVEVHSIGAGGGSIAWIDPGGLLRVGPQSAGADPGPVCYARGGTQPTVTDSALVLGYIDSEYFLGGLMALDTERAHAAVGALGAQLGLSPEETAAGVLTIAASSMVTAIAEITINQGIDPREATLVAGGGASGLFAVQIARELGVRTVVIPPLSAGLSACGAQLGDIVVERARSLLTRSDAFAYADVAGELAGLRDEVLETLGGEPAAERWTESALADARYPNQAWELRTPIRGGAIDTPEDLERLTDDFHALHQRTFAVSNEREVVEFVSWRMRGVYTLGKPEMTYLAPDGSAGGHADRSRPAYFAETGFTDCEVVVLGEGRSRARIVEGPAIVENPTTTLVVNPGSVASITADGLIVITVR